MGYFERRKQRSRRKVKQLEEAKTFATARLMESQETMAEMMVMVAAKQVSENNLRTDEELREDLTDDPDKVRRMLATHERSLQLLYTRFKEDPDTPKVDTQLRRKIAMMQQILRESGS
jgi:hypothetical protein